MTFKCADCENDIFYTRESGEYYFTIEDYKTDVVVGFKNIMDDKPICDICYAKDNEFMLFNPNNIAVDNE